MTGRVPAPCGQGSPRAFLVIATCLASIFTTDPSLLIHLPVEVGTFDKETNKFAFNPEFRSENYTLCTSGEGRVCVIRNYKPFPENVCADSPATPNESWLDDNFLFGYLVRVVCEASAELTTWCRLMRDASSESMPADASACLVGLLLNQLRHIVHYRFKKAEDWSKYVLEAIQFDPETAPLLKMVKWNQENVHYMSQLIESWRDHVLGVIREDPEKAPLVEMVQWYPLYDFVMVMRALMRGAHAIKHVLWFIDLVLAQQLPQGQTPHGDGVGAETARILKELARAHHECLYPTQKDST